MRFSVVIAAYNVEKYIEKCLDSVTNQDYKGLFEIIVVNDNSWDNTKRIVSKYSSNRNILLINNNKNLKLSKVRQIGINLSKGDYILNIDGDDTINKNTLSVLSDYIDLYSPDIIAFNLCLEFLDGKKNIPTNNFIVDNKYVDDKLDVYDYFFGAAVTKLVKKDICDKLFISDYSISHSEDLLYCSEIFFKSKKILMIEDVLYNYLQRPESITKEVNYKNFLKDQITVVNVFENLHKKYFKKNKEIFKNYEQYFLRYNIAKIFDIKSKKIKLDLIFFFDDIRANNCCFLSEKSLMILQSCIHSNFKLVYYFLIFHSFKTLIFKIIKL